MTLITPRRWLMVALVACVVGGLATACGDAPSPTGVSAAGQLHVTTGPRKDEFGDAVPIDGVVIIAEPDPQPDPLDLIDPCSVDPWVCGYDPIEIPTDPNDPGTGSDATPAPPPPSTQDNALDAIPDCSKTQTKATLAAYCRGNEPDSTQTSRIRSTLAAMRALGGPCVMLADLGAKLLDTGRIRIYSALSTDSFGGAAPLGGALAANGGPTGPNAWLISQDIWVNTYYDANHHTTVTTTEKYQRNLQNDLAHELDHLLGHDHIDADGWNTVNSRACSGLP